MGALILSKAISAPLQRIVQNAGKNSSLIIERIQKENFNIGYNAADDFYGDMYNLGIVDPAKVTRSALQNATSIAGMILTTECIIVDN
jgi:chaperonin GroEL